MVATRECLEDDHAAAAAWAARPRVRGRGGTGLVRATAVRLRLRHGEQGAGAHEVRLAAGAGEKAVMANAVEALGQHVEQKTPDELARIERHDLVALSAVAAIVLAAEGDAPLVERDQPRVGDRDAVGVARQIGQHSLGPCEGRLGVDEPVLPAQGRQERRQRRAGR